VSIDCKKPCALLALALAFPTVVDIRPGYRARSINNVVIKRDCESHLRVPLRRASAERRASLKIPPVASFREKRRLDDSPRRHRREAALILEFPENNERMAKPRVNSSPN